MAKYKCLNCGYAGDTLVFQFNDYGYCVATNSLDPDYIGSAPEWVSAQGFGAAEIGEPVACPSCHAWGITNFELVDVERNR